MSEAPSSRERPAAAATATDMPPPLPGLFSKQWCINTLGSHFALAGARNVPDAARGPAPRRPNTAGHIVRGRAACGRGPRAGRGAPLAAQQSGRACPRGRDVAHARLCSVAAVMRHVAAGQAGRQARRGAAGRGPHAARPPSPFRCHAWPRLHTQCGTICRHGKGASRVARPRDGHRHFWDVLMFPSEAQRNGHS